MKHKSKTQTTQGNAVVSSFTKSFTAFKMNVLCYVVDKKMKRLKGTTTIMIEVSHAWFGMCVVWYDVGCWLSREQNSHLMYSCIISYLFVILVLEL